MGGRDLLSAGYVMYSSSTVLVLSVGDGVVGFTLDNLIGDFVMTHADIKLPETGKIYSFNEGNAANWSEWLKNYMSHVKAPEGEGSSPYSARYIGSLVGDFHRTMLYGGIYGYPGDKKNVNGKLRLIYECAPMSFLAEQAGRGLHRRRPRPGPAARGCAPALPALHRLQEGGREARGVLQA